MFKVTKVVSNDTYYQSRVVSLKRSECLNNHLLFWIMSETICLEYLTFIEWFQIENVYLTSLEKVEH